MQNQAGNAQYLLYFENFSGTVFAGIPIGSTSKTEGSRTVNGGTYFNGVSTLNTVMVLEI